MADDAGDEEWGTYTLVFALPGPTAIEVSALGSHELPAGGYAYTGSALGSGGFSRVDRHRRVAAGDHGVRHWHVDYLGGHPATTLETAVRAPGRDVECAVADALADGPVEGFGASDCGCRSHLARYDSAERALAATERVYDAV